MHALPFHSSVIRALGAATLAGVLGLAAIPAIVAAQDKPQKVVLRFAADFPPPPHPAGLDATYVDPIWNSGLVQTSQVGLHIFYRFPRGAEWASVERNFQARKNAVAIQLAALDADAEDGVDESLLFADGSSAGDDGYYAITPTTAPAAVTTSTRTITTTAPRLMSIQTVPAEKEAAKPAEIALDAYTARQIGVASSASVDGAL
jgi:hypothetical protein